MSAHVDVSAGLLFPVVESLSPRLAWCKRVKAELQVFTHCHKESKWMGFSHVKAVEFLGGENLAFSIRTDPFALFSNYCRLLDEAGFVADHMATEEDVIEFVALAHGIKLWNEEGGA